MPNSCCSDLIFVGVSMLMMADTLLGSAASPLSVFK